MWRYQRRQSRRAWALVERVSTPLVSIVVPAHNEELTIVHSIRALLALDYETREIVVVNDGSADGTLALLQQTFALLPAPLAYVQPIATAPVRGIYRSASDPALVVVDKESGGCKADASNAGINAASGDLVLVIDADTVLEPDALTRTILPFLEDPSTVAVGANVAIVNGCRVENGRVTRVALPRNWFARLQIVEYMRAFMMFRVACAA
jgi:cellulose synthase/poly-beta-1,6-N-acetylglucosamine synthase-like glycosyltransferase